MKTRTFLFSLFCLGLSLISCGGPGASGPDASSDNAATADDADAVDLGLSVRWGACNLGASSPADFGDFYAWGETAAKGSFTEQDCLAQGLSYSQLQAQGVIGSDGNLTAVCDVAHERLGGGWRMPTIGEMKELLNRCVWSWTSQEGVQGYRVKGPNGNAIFIPAAGYRSCDLGHVYVGVGAWLRSSTVSEGSETTAKCLALQEGNRIACAYSRSLGCSVRPVTE